MTPGAITFGEAGVLNVVDLDGPRDLQGALPIIINALSNIGRFGGQTRQPYSVADHLELCLRLAKRVGPALCEEVINAPWGWPADKTSPFDSPKNRAQWRELVLCAFEFAAVTHDFCEAFGLGDIVSPMKSLLHLHVPGLVPKTVSDWEARIHSEVVRALAAGATSQFDTRILGGADRTWFLDLAHHPIIVAGVKRIDEHALRAEADVLVGGIKAWSWEPQRIPGVDQLVAGRLGRPRFAGAPVDVRALLLRWFEQYHFISPADRLAAVDQWTAWEREAKR